MKNKPSQPEQAARAGSSTLCSRIAQALLVAVLVLPLALAPPLAAPQGAVAAGGAVQARASSQGPTSASAGGVSLESAASKAEAVGRKVAMSLIGLGFAIAAVVLVLRRDFKEAAGVVAVGGLAVVLATPAGVDVVHATVKTLFGSA